MALLKFLFDSFRPISKTADIWDFKDILQAILIFGGWSSGGWFTMTANPSVAIWVLSGIPALLFLIAGVKLQFRLQEIEHIYHHALSLDNDFDFDWTNEIISLGLKFSNAINKPIEYELLAGKTYIEIGDSPRLYLPQNIKETISALKSTISPLPAIAKPTTYPCNGILHYELAYGYPNKPLFRQKKEFSLKIDYVWINQQKEMKIIGTLLPGSKDEPIKKRDFDKEGSQT